MGTPNAPAIQVIETVISIGSQSIEYKEIIKYKGFKLRICIKSDSYDFQCFARIGLLKDLKWEVLEYIPHSEMQTESQLKYRPAYRGEGYKNAASEFLKDRNKLIETAISLLD